MALRPHHSDVNAPGLRGTRILVVEDQYLLASEIQRMLLRVGAEVVGPAPSVVQALGLVAGEHLDAAVLDVNLDGEDSYPVAEALARKGVPFLFLTGYERWVLPPTYASVERLDKPFNARELAQTLSRIIPSRTVIGTNSG